MSTNEFGGEIGGITLLGKAHSLSALFIVLLRAVIGGMILFAGLGKVSEWPFDAAGYLVHGVDAASPVSGLYAIVSLTVAAFGAGRILGLDAYIERLEVGGQALIERFPALRYVLG